jgi:putative sigma-54 modulation protein
MKYIIRGDKILVTDSIKKYIKEKIDKLDKYFEKSNEIEATVLIKVKGFNQKIEVTIPTNNFIIRNEETSEDLYAAIDKVADKIERQIRKNKTKISQVERNCTKKMMLDFLSEEEEKEESKIVKRKKLDTKPMDEEEAILQMEMLGHDFFIYKDRNTGKVCVLYRRKDNNYGIIETE